MAGAHSSSAGAGQLSSRPTANGGGVAGAVVDRPASRRHDPLTDRILARLPGPRWPWIAAWALLPAMHYVVLVLLMSAAGHAAHPALSWRLLTAALSSHAVQGYMIVIAFVASRKLAADVRALRPAIARLVPAPGGDPSSLFAGLGGAVMPAVFTVVVAALESADTAMRWGLTSALLFFPYQAVWILPMVTLFWVYIALLIDLDRLGRKRMNLGSFPEDLSLGLGPIGAVVFHAFLIFCALTVPFLLVSLRDWLDLGIGLAFFGVGVGAFFLSTWRLHRQMVETKIAHVARAGALYSETYEPLRIEMTPASVQACAGPLSAAEALLRRAAAIQEWPFDERTMTRIVAISTGVATAVIARSVLSAIGL